MGEGERHPVDSGEPILVWAPDAGGDSGNSDDDYEDGVWIDTRVSSGSPSRGTIELALRQAEEDDDDDVVRFDERIAVSCSLETGALTPLRTEGGIFLKRHPWLESALRDELPRFRRRAQRAAEQTDRESAAKRALARAGNAMLPYHDLFPADWDLLPVCDGQRYWAIDLYCRNPSCDCSSSVIQFHRVDGNSTTFVGEVTVDYTDNLPRAKSSAPIAANVFERLWKESEYSLRARHTEASNAVRRFARRAPDRAALAATSPPIAGRVPRNAPCPCGSGKKFKRCCLDANAPARS